MPANFASAKLSDSNSVAAASSILFLYPLIPNGNVLRSAVCWPNASTANLMGKVDKLIIDHYVLTKTCRPSRNLTNHQIVDR